MPHSLLCWRGKKSSEKRRDEATQCQRNWNAYAPSTTTATAGATTAVAVRQNYRHIFLIRHGKYICKESVSGQDSALPASPTPIPASRKASTVSSRSRGQPPPGGLGASAAPRRAPSLINPRTPAANEASDRSRGVYPGGSVDSSENYGRLETAEDQRLSQHKNMELEGSLSEAGRCQMRATAQRLKELKVDFDKIYVSDLMRAKESGEIISGMLTMMEEPEVDALLNEGTFPPDGNVTPQPTHAELESLWSNFPAKRRFEDAFKKYAQKPPRGAEDVFEILVCHCNIIKYFVHKALGIDTLGLRRFSNAWFPCHASITILSISAHGQVFLRTLGDSGHLDISLVTVNNVNQDVFWNSWTPLPPQHTVNPPAVVPTIARNPLYDLNMTQHATSERDFSPKLSPFAALVIGTGKAVGETDEVDDVREDKGAVNTAGNFAEASPSSSSSPLALEQQASPGPPKVWNRLSFDDYRECCVGITQFVRSRDDGSIAKSQLYEWVLSQRETLLRGCETTGEREKLAMIVINRLVDVDLVLIQCDDDGNGQAEKVLRVHPNFTET